MNTVITSLTVLKALARDKLFVSLAEYDACQPSEKKERFNDLLYEIYSRGAECDLAGYISNLIISDENAFSHRRAKGENCSFYVSDSFIQDLINIQNAVEKLRGNGRFEVGFWDDLLCGAKDAIVAKLGKYYARNGYGIYIKNRAFRYKNGEIAAVKSNDGLSLSDLKDYVEEKKIITDNVSDFLGGLPYSHMLLYGDKGTGKSSTVHAIINQFANRKLRLVEICREDIQNIPEICAILSEIPLKFILFMDDLSLDSESGDITALKTILEGSFSCPSENVMFVATSNRRHIVKENVSDRENALHPTDSMEEQLSLSDRFGLTVMFSSTDKQSYLSIVTQLADDCKIKCDRASLCDLAERWAIVKGGRSPRRAKQFIDLVYACEQAGRQIEF